MGNISSIINIPPISEILRTTGLHAESTSFFWRPAGGSSYYGFNVSKTQLEPIDQIHGFIAAARLQEAQLKGGVDEVGTFHAFIAGQFEILNARNLDELEQTQVANEKKDIAKKHLFEEIFTRFRMKGKVWVSQDLFSEDRFWETFAEILKDQRFSQGTLLNDAMKWYNSREELEAVVKVGDLPENLVRIPTQIRKKLRSWPASLMYTPLEVAEARYFARYQNVKVKIGHMDERVYDKYILEDVDIVHLRQPSDFKSTRLKPRGVTPYIHKERRDPKIRIFFGDTAEDIRSRISAYPAQTYIETLSERLGPIHNPYVDKAILAVESAYCAGKKVTIGQVEMMTGIDILDALWRGSLTMEQLERELPELLEQNICSIRFAQTNSMMV